MLENEEEFETVTIEEAEGNIDSLYAHWMLGEAARTERPPRWSVIRDVFGWVD